MRTLFLVAAGGTIVLAFACGGDDATIANPGDGGGGDGATDASSNKDAAGSDGGQDAGPDSSSQNDSGASDAGIDVSITCLDPSTCISLSDVCCGTIVTGAGTPPACPITGIGSKCTSASSCPTAFAFSCSASESVRLCKSNGQCTESAYNKCCTFKPDGGSISFCASASIADAGGGSCM